MIKKEIMEVPILEQKNCYSIGDEANESVERYDNRKHKGSLC